MTTIYFEDVVLGEQSTTGSYTFEEADIIAFAKKYDPQPIHADPGAAKLLQYGGLVASGWHLCAVWMKLMIANRIQSLKDNPDAPRSAGQGSPGFRDLRWHHPVRPGDTVTYSNMTSEKVELKSRSDIGIIRSNNEARLDDGTLVMTFVGQGLFGRRP